MKIKVNNKVQELTEERITISELLVKNDVEMPEMVSVQLNGEFVKKEKFEVTVLKDNDEVDFLYFMGGGSLI
ncbi:MAG: sulfur carrier protein ThiS [bacterium]|nr:sulfur carrier protein ThiS [bacterium]